MPDASSPFSAGNSPSHVAAGQLAKRRRTIRVTVACLRCQRRKIRCDGALPSCGSCAKARVECLDGGKLDGIESPRAYIASLKTRVAWLENIITTKCPEVDLSKGPSILDESHKESSGNGENSGIEHTLVAPGSSRSPINNSPPHVESNGASQERPAESSKPQSGQDKQIDQNEQQSNIVHEIGLVTMSAGTDRRYIGPSSGYFFAKVVLACARQNQRKSPPTPKSAQNIDHRSALFFTKGEMSIPPTPLPESMEYTIRISDAYFETLHLQYPFLHRPSHMTLIEHVYADADPAPNDLFQVYLVLAIGAIVLSRRLKVPLSAEGFCASAMKYFDKFCIENSLKGLQSLLLLQIYTLNNSFMGLNAWYLNYQCIAALLDLGLQRDVKSGTMISVLEQELRTRAFWVIYSLDRSIATMMGRPIGLRDEACELRLPADVDDNRLTEAEIRPRLENEPPTSMTIAVHMFKLAQMNSEMKYILHSISHDVPPYSYPSIPDVHQWQNDMARRLRSWFNQIPQLEGDRIYFTKISQIKYHGMLMQLLRPSPRIPNPSVDSLKACFDSAVESIRLYDQLYKSDLLIYGWETAHVVFLSTLTMLHCIWTIPDIAAKVQLNTLMADLKAGSNVLSAAGEHRPEVKRNRDVLDEISGTTINWIIETRARSMDSQADLGQSRQSGNVNPDQQPVDRQSPGNYDLAPGAEFNLQTTWDGQDFGPFWSGDNIFDQVDFGNPTAVNNFMQSIFTEFQPMHDNDYDMLAHRLLERQN